MSPIDPRDPDQYTISLSSNKLLLTICSVLLLMVLSMMLGIRIERHQQREARELAARGLMSGQAADAAAIGEEPTMMPPAPARAPDEPGPRRMVMAGAEPAVVSAEPVPVKPAIRAEDLSDTVPPPPTPALLAQASAAPAPAPKPAATPKQPAPKAAAKAADGDRYVIQVASTRDRARATEGAQLLGTHGITAFVESADLGKQGVWYRVLAGEFGSKAEATAVQARLKQDPRFESSFVRSY